MERSLTQFITGNSKKIILVFVIASLIFAYGATEVSMSSELDQFQSDAPEITAQSYIQENFSISNETSVQIVIKQENVLNKSSLLKILDYEQKLKQDSLINSTLPKNQSIVSIANLIAINSITDKKIEKIENKTHQIRKIQAEINQKQGLVTDLLNQSRQIQNKINKLNQSYEEDEINETIYEQRLNDYREKIDQFRLIADSNLSNSQYKSFISIQSTIISLQNQINLLNYDYQQGIINESIYESNLSELNQEMSLAYNEISSIFESEFQKTEALSEEIEEIREGLTETPSLRDQVEHLKEMSEEELDSVKESVFSNQSMSGSGFSAFALMPLDFDEEEMNANSTMIIVTQKAEDEAHYASSDDITDSQNRMKTIGEDVFSKEDLMVLGQGIITEEIDQSMDDSLKLILPLALFFVVVILIVSYRDFLDILLGVFGVLLVLVWTFGVMGLLDISFNQMFVAIPALLTGLSVDFAIHVIMRHREEMEENKDYDIRKAMKIALTGVGTALAWVTITTIIGFLSNLSSPVPPIREFGVISSFGIFSALLVFGAFIPSLKSEIDTFLEKRGFNRRKRAFGTSGITKKALSLGSSLAKKKPLVVIFVVFLITLAGAYGSTKVDTSFKQEDFLAENPPDWMDYLPEQIRPGEYSIKQNLDFLNQNYAREDQQVQLLLKGDVSEGKALYAVDEAHKLLKDSDVVLKLSNDEIRVESPLDLIKETADTNESFNRTYKLSDVDNDGIPDQNITTLFQKLEQIKPQETQTLIYESQGKYEALRLIVSVKGDAQFSEINDDFSEIADSIEKKGIEVTATGDPIVFHIVESNIFDTAIQSLILALAAVFLFIVIAFRLIEGSASLGFLTLLPVLLIVFWIVGTMYALDISFNVMTALITNLTIGLGIDYSIHISERFKQEFREKEKSIHEALDETITGTGGALLGSAMTTIGGFGVLALAILPPIKQFGLITAITIAYSFIGAVLILPSLLVIWARSEQTDEIQGIKKDIEIKDLIKSYKGNIALKQINLEIDNEIIGLIGPNGSGKTTLMKILSGEIKNYKGQVKIFGKDIKKNKKIREKIGYLPEKPEFYEEMTGYRFLEYMNRLNGNKRYEASKTSFNWLKEVGLENKGNKKIKEYSKGMKQRLGIAEAFLNNPKIVLLDEPTKDLDPVSREKILELIKGLSKEDKTIIIATHSLSELREVIDEIILLKDGSIIEKKKIDQIKDLKKYYKENLGGKDV